MPRRSTVGSAIQKSVLVRAPSGAVYAALAEPERLRSWYFDDASVDPREGGTLQFGGIEGVVKATVRRVSPGEELAFEFHAPWWGLVSFLIKPAGEGTRVYLTHEGFEGREEWLDRFAWGWDAHLKNLKAYVEGRPVK